MAMKLRMLYLAATAAVLACGLLGCETESAAQRVRISPSSARISKGESITFKASGGYLYEWALDPTKNDWGVLSASEGDTTTYTSLYDPGTNNTATQVLTVHSRLTDSDVTSTNGGYHKTAEVLIVHYGPDARPSPPAATLSISPSSANVTNTQQVSFSVSGGSSPYSWSLSNPTWGNLSSTSGSSTTYTSATTSTGNQTVTAGDSRGATATATVRHQ